MTLLRTPPPPLVNRERKVIVLWSPKSACTTIYVWFSNLYGFLDEVETVDTHYRPQLHPFESERKPDIVINISKSNLFAELNAVEKGAGWPHTDFAAMPWLHELESSRRPPPYPESGADMFRTPIRRGNPKEQTPFPEYGSRLMPKAKTLIDSICRDDFAAYRDFL